MAVALTTGESTIETTIHHPFWVIRGHELELRSTPRELSDTEDQSQKLEGRWVNSHELMAGDVLVGKDGAQRVVESISQRYEDELPVSNLTIGDHHNYAVGSDSILVHNESLCASGEQFLRNLIVHQGL